jgi:translocation and assembly module TamB
LTAPEPPETIAENGAEPQIRGKRRLLRRFLILMVSLVLIVALVGVAARFVVLSPQAMLIIEARTSGLKLGRIGELKIEGISGDVWTDFAVKRLTISDEAGVWLEARNLSVQWDYWQLFGRRLSAQSIDAEKVDVYRRPILTPKVRDSALPVSFDIDSLTMVLETHPDFSIEQGLFAAAANFRVERNGGTQGAVAAASLLHEGDGIQAAFRFGEGQSLNIRANATEAEGGAIAGALGLSADRPLLARANIGGEADDGEIDVVVQTGEETPIEVTGGWNSEGMTAMGRLDLTASTLTSTLVEMFGPNLNFDARGESAGEEGIYAFELQAEAANLTLALAGPVDVNAQSSPGLAVEARVADMSRIVSEPALGPTSFDGTFRGSLTDLELDGDLTAERLQLADYTLGRISGPARLSLADGELTISGDLRGTGGSGEGILAALFGASPNASITLSRLPDGRFLFRSIEAEGAGLTISAQGSRTPVIGTLNFDGDLRLSNLAAARAGADGVIEASWSAAQGRGGDWTFTADATGAEFSTGMEELDRLIGTTPRLDARARLDGNVWRIERAILNGDAGEARGTGTFGPENALDLEIAWEAEGPFQAGPVEIAGVIDGDGTVTGTLMAPRAELQARVGGIDVGPLALDDAIIDLIFEQDTDGSSGSVALTAEGPNGPANASADFAFPENGVDLSNLTADVGGLTAQGALALRNNQPSMADLTFTLVAGAFVESGRADGRILITDSAEGPQGDLTLQATNLQLADSMLMFETLNLTAEGSLERMPYVVQARAARGTIPFELDGSGIASQSDNGWNVSFEGDGSVNEIEFATVDPILVEFGGPELSAQGLLAMGGGQAAFRASQTESQVDVRAELMDVDLTVLSPDMAGRFDADLVATGSGDVLTGTLQANLQNMRSRDGPVESAIDGVLSAELDNDVINVDVRATNELGLNSVASVSLPAETSATPFRVAIVRNEPMDGGFLIDGELQPVWDLFFGGARTLGGRFVARGSLSGTINDPQLAGEASLENGRFEDFATGLKLTNVTAAADLQRTAIDLTEFTAQDERRGRLTGSGRISLEAGGGSSLTLMADQFLLIDNDLAEAQASGEVVVTRDADGRIALRGDLTIDRADVVADPPTPSGVVPLNVIEINVPPERADYFDAPTSRGPAVALDVDLSAPGRIFLRGRGLDIEMSLDAHVGGTTGNPVLTGEARVVRGEYEFAGKRFEFEESGVVYLATSAEDIRLDLEATRSAPTLTATVSIAGTAARPEITLSSIPSLPDDEVLSQVLFGRSASQLSPLEQAQIAASVGALATGGGFDIVGGLREFAGLDRLVFGGGDASGLTVSGGKYISDDVYLELTGGGREGGAVQVEWRVRGNLSFVSRVGGDGDTRLSVRWRRVIGLDEDADD